ncbi:hypothetical protein M513_14016 [Trichuris suis]|uniref:Uncharacterized protein n=1 Tax=Trichuris suis TaxID=68888 RepID=A0A085LJG1_9BILA|nr:hypothetical protein M513_14016 [Trichuris suis]
MLMGLYRKAHVEGVIRTSGVRVSMPCLDYNSALTTQQLTEALEVRRSIASLHLLECETYRS